MSLPTGRFLINRGAEKMMLDDILHAGARQRILLLQASSGYGKSLLLENYWSEIEERGHELAVIKLDRGGLDAIDVLASVCHQWGWERFPRFHAALDELAAPTRVDVKAGIQIGYNRSQISLPENPAQRRVQMHELTLVWFDDLRSYLGSEKPAVMLIDTYNLVGTPERSATVSAELHGWIEDVFLTQVQRTAALRVILAGQQTPEPSLTPWQRCCRRHSLGPIDSPDDWQQYAEHVGARVTRETISAFCHTERGHPFAIATRLMMLRSWSFGI